MNQEDALKFILNWLRAGGRSEYPNYGYDMYVPNVLREYVRSSGECPDTPEGHKHLKAASPVFFDAAWELCRRGIIRPGVQMIGAQSTDEGSAGSGFSVTPFGRQWLSEATEDNWVPTEPGRFAEMLEPFRDRFGPGFYSRAQEAIRCYGAHAYLACCAMCGAAAESVLLATAIAKTGDEEKVLKAYATAKGRLNVESMVLGQAREELKREFRGLTGLLKYWRDDAAHGSPSTIAENEAYTSLAMLLRYASFAHQNWAELTSVSAQLGFAADHPSQRFGADAEAQR